MQMRSLHSKVLSTLSNVCVQWKMCALLTQPFSSIVGCFVLC